MDVALGEGGVARVVQERLVEGGVDVAINVVEAVQVGHVVVDAAGVQLKVKKKKKTCQSARFSTVIGAS